MLRSVFPRSITRPRNTNVLTKRGIKLKINTDGEEDSDSQVMHNGTQI